MSNEIDDGGPAFPATADQYEHGADPFETGMTLRDYFAAHAPFGAMCIEYADDDAAKRYRWADAMLKARQQ